jgi:hypothetical protein
MKRRQFLKQTLAVATTTGLALESARAAERNAPADKREYYELRRYRLKDAAGKGALSDYFKKALMPALNRLSFKPIGAFDELEPKDGVAIWLLIPMSSADAAGRIALGLAGDAEFKGAGAAWLDREKGNPGFERIDSWLHVAFSGMPKLAIPDLTNSGSSRVFEMRTYESYGEMKALKKIQMFNSGEIQVMNEVKLRPVFYGQALIGRDLPHLTYMLCGENREEHKKHFEAFTKHPIWLKLKNDPEYADTVSKITSRFLEPLEFSQI